jgi:peroxiredoxin
MKPVIRNIFIALLVAIAGLATFVLMPSTQQPMPEFSFTDIDGGEHHMLDYKGKPILMIFWATDCPGCIKELPELIALHDDYAAQGLTMISVAMPHDSPEHLKTMRDQKGLPYMITWDKKGDISDAFGNVRVTPTHFLISPEGEIVMRKIGALKTEQLKQRLAAMGLQPKQS